MAEFGAHICRECWGEGGAEIRGGHGPCERCGRVGPADLVNAFTAPKDATTAVLFPSYLAAAELIVAAMRVPSNLGVYFAFADSILLSPSDGGIVIMVLPQNRTETTYISPLAEPRPPKLSDRRTQLFPDEMPAPKPEVSKD